MSNVHQAEFDTGSRGANYRLANDNLPFARQAELLQMFHKIEPKADQVIIECGTGNGFLSLPLASAIGPRGMLYTLDDAQSNLDAVKAKADAIGLKNIHYVLLDQNYFASGKFPLDNIKADTIASIATFHHYDDMKQSALKEFKRLIKPDGKLVIADVSHGTKPQIYFDEFVHGICSTGHDHRFLTRETLLALAKPAGFEIKDWQQIYVPWIFDNHQNMGQFLHTIHDATCSFEESISGAKKFLGITQFSSRFVINWELFYATMRIG